MTDPSPMFMTAAEAARISGIPASTLLNLARRGEISKHPIGRSVRFTQQDLDDYAESIRVAKKSPFRLAPTRKRTPR